MGVKMKLKMKIKVKYKAFMYVYKPQVDPVKTPAQIIKPVFASKAHLMPAHALIRA
jgi:hypothetical protein